MFAMFGREAIRPRRRSAESPWNLREHYPSRRWMDELSNEAGFEEKPILQHVDERAKYPSTRHSSRFELRDPMRGRCGTKLGLEQRLESVAIGNAIGVGHEARVASELRVVESVAQRFPRSVGRGFHCDKSIHGRESASNLKLLAR
jgi:hypothetical protein